jgi:hypothetical protein
MFNRSLIAFSIVALAAVGCGGGDDTTTVTTGDMATAGGADLAGAHLQSGTYNVSNIVKISDGCGLVFEGDAANNIMPLMTLQLANTGTMLSLGNKFDSTTTPQWNPAGYSAGTGTYTDATHATLTSMATVTLPDMCTFTTMRTTMATFTGMNMMSIDFTDVESNYDATKCASDMPPMTPPCTSHYTFNLAM